MLLRDILRYPTPYDPYKETGHLRRQSTTGGVIEATGEYFISNQTLGEFIS